MDWVASISASAVGGPCLCPCWGQVAESCVLSGATSPGPLLHRWGRRAAPSCCRGPRQREAELMLCCSWKVNGGGGAKGDREGEATSAWMQLPVAWRWHSPCWLEAAPVPQPGRLGGGGRKQQQELSWKLPGPHAVPLFLASVSERA